MYQLISKKVLKVYGLTGEVRQNQSKAADLLEGYRYLCHLSNRAAGKLKWTAEELYRLVYDALCYGLSKDLFIRAQPEEFNYKFVCFVALCVHFTLQLYNTNPTDTNAQTFCEVKTGTFFLFPLLFPLRPQHHWALLSGAASLYEDICTGFLSQDVPGFAEKLLQIGKQRVRRIAIAESTWTDRDRPSSKGAAMIETNIIALIATIDAELEEDYRLPH